MNENNDFLPSPEEPADSTEQTSMDLVVESNFVELDQPGEYPPPEPPKKQIKPATLALGILAGMVVLCLVMLVILLLLFLPEMLAGLENTQEIPLFVAGCYTMKA